MRPNLFPTLFTAFIIACLDRATWSPEVELSEVSLCIGERACIAVCVVVEIVDDGAERGVGGCFDVVEAV